jgi:hypothetical protein
VSEVGWLRRQAVGWSLPRRGGAGPPPAGRAYAAALDAEIARLRRFLGR